MYWSILSGAISLLVLEFHFFELHVSPIRMGFDFFGRPFMRIKWVEWRNFWVALELNCIWLIIPSV
jgi:hypothetical protein